MIELINKKVILDNLYEIRYYYTEKGEVQALCYDGCIQSIEYVDKNKKNTLCNDYLYFFDLPIYLNPLGKEYLVLGGGAFSYPKYFIHKHKNKKMTVIEKEKCCLEYANRYFSLADFTNINDYSKNRLNIIIDDALYYLKNCKKSYDYILIDLFNGKDPINTIYDKEYIKEIKRILNKNGIIIINYIINNSNQKDYKIYLKNIISQFKFFRIISNNLYYNSNLNIGNIILLLSEQEIEIKNNLNFEDISYIVD